MLRLGHRALGASTSALALMVWSLSAAAYAQPASYGFDIPAEDLGRALQTFARVAGQQVVYDGATTAGKVSTPLKGSFSADDGLRILLTGSGLTFHRGAQGVLMITEPQPRAEGATPDRASAYAVGEVVVTGSHIHGAPVVSGNLTTITRSDIDLGGFATTADLMASVPQNFSGLTPASESALGTRGGIVEQNINNATSIDLRGLGPQATLTLLDGQRISGADIGRVVDVSTLPIELIDRVDVLTDGNSAIYGSDAVGGVVNFVLKHSYDGALTSAYYGASVYGGEDITFDQLFGKTFDRGGFLIGYDYAHDQSFNEAKAGLTTYPNVYGELLSNEPLAPDTVSHTVYASGQYDVTAGVQVYGDASFVWRSQASNSLTQVPSANLSIPGAHSEYDHVYDVVVGSNIQLPSLWSLNLSGATSGYNESRQSSEFELLGATTLGSSVIATRDGSSLSTGSAVADGPIPWFLDGAKAAIGGQVEYETISTSQNVSSGGTIVNADRTTGSVFGEVHLPLIPESAPPIVGRLDLSLAARYDHYSDFGGTFNPQGSLKWSLPGGVALRGSLASAFRAPDLFELYGGTYESLENVDVCTGSSCAARPGLILSDGNPSLRPEKATTQSIAIDFAPPQARWFKASVSYFNIDYRDRIAFPFTTFPTVDTAYAPGDAILNPTASQVSQYQNAPDAEPLFDFTATPFNPKTQQLQTVFPNLAIILNNYQNIALESVNGLDFAANGTFGLPKGTLALGLNGTYTLNHTGKYTPTTVAQPLSNEVGLPAPLRLRANAGWGLGAFSTALYINVVGSYRDQFTTPYSTIPTFITADATIGIDGSKLSSTSSFRGWQLFLSAQNLADVTSRARSPKRLSELSLASAST